MVTQLGAFVAEKKLSKGLRGWWAEACIAPREPQTAPAYLVAVPAVTACLLLPVDSYRAHYVVPTENRLCELDTFFSRHAERAARNPHREGKRRRPRRAAAAAAAEQPNG